MPSHIPTVLNPRDGQTYMNDEQRDELAAGLEELAAWIRETPTPIPRYAGWGLSYGIQINSKSFNDGDMDFAHRPGHIARAIGGKVEKGTDGLDNYTLTRRFRGRIPVVFTIDRTAVCTAVEVEKSVEKAVPEDANAAKELERQMKALEDEKERIERQVRELPTTTVTVTEVVKEWECPPSLLALDKAVSETKAATSAASSDIAF